MPFVRETSPNVFAEIDASQTIVVHNNGRPDVQWPGSIVNVWSAEALAEIGIYRVEPAVCPAGRRVTGTRYERVNGAVTQVLDTELTLAGAPPALVAAAFNLTVSADAGVESVEAMFNVLGAMYLGVGQYMMLFAEPQPDSGYSPLLTGGDGALLNVTDKAVDAFTIEARTASGDYVEPSRFSFQVFRI
jgi:hypothetical protein